MSKSLDIIASPRIKDMWVPMTPSEALPCFGCQENIWVSREIRSDLPNAKWFCYICVSEERYKEGLEEEFDQPIAIMPEDRKEFLESRRRMN